MNNPNDGNQTVQTTRRVSFFNIAAWASLVVPFITLAFTLGLPAFSGYMNFVSQPSRQFIGNLHGSAFLVDAGSFVLGIVSLFGMRRHGAAFILWKALPGLFASSILGFYHFGVMMMSSIVC